MLRFDHHCNTEGAGDLLDGFGDLPAEVFLDLQAACVHVDDAGDFRQTEYLAVGDIGDMGLADKGQQVVFTQRVQLDVLHQHHFAVVGAEQRAVGDFFEGLLIALAQVLHGFGGALGRVEQAFAGYVFAKLAKDLGVLLFQGHGQSRRSF